MKRILLIFSTLLIISTFGVFADTANQNVTKNMSTAQICDLLKPVGSYFETEDANFNPNNVWGGTWYLETEGLVHVSGGTNYPVSSTYTDTVNGSTVGQKQGGYYETKVPNHVHAVPATGTSTYNQNRNHYHQYGYKTDSQASGGKGDQIGGYGYSSDFPTAQYKYTTTQSAGHTHTLTSAQAWTGYASATSPTLSMTDYMQFQANIDYSNMMPYKCVYRWHRVA